MTFQVTIRFQFPAWDEVRGIEYEIEASSKSEAIKRARYEARRDGHLPCTGKGRATLSAQAI